MLDAIGLCLTWNGRAISTWWERGSAGEMPPTPSEYKESICSNPAPRAGSFCLVSFALAEEMMGSSLRGLWRALLWVSLLVLVVEVSGKPIQDSSRRHFRRDASSSSGSISASACHIKSRALGPATSPVLSPSSGATPNPTLTKGAAPNRSSSVRGKASLSAAVCSSRPRIGTAAVSTPLTTPKRGSSSRKLNPTSAAVCSSRRRAASSVIPTPMSARGSSSDKLKPTSAAVCSSRRRAASSVIPTPMSARGSSSDKLKPTSAAVCSSRRRAASSVIPTLTSERTSGISTGKASGTGKPAVISGSATSGDSTDSATSTSSSTRSTTSTPKVTRFTTQDTSTSSSSSTKTTDTTTSSTTSEFPYKSVCKSDGRNNATWQKENMGEWVQFRANEIPKDYGKSFLDWMTNEVAGFLNGNNIVIAYDGTAVVGGSQSDCEADKQNALDYYTIEAIANVGELANLVLGSVEYAKEAFTGYVDSLVKNFISQAISMASEFIEMIVGSVMQVGMAFLVPYISPLVKAALIEGEAAVNTILEYESSIASFLDGAATSAGAVAERDIDVEANLEDIIGKQVTNLYDGMQDYFNGLVNGIAYNNQPQQDYATNKSGLPYLLKSGMFASSPTTNTVEGITNFTTNGIIAAAINIVFKERGIYVVHTTYDKAYGSNTCKTTLKNDLVRVCDGNDAYFLLEASYTWPTEGNDAITGWDKFADYGLTLLQFIKAAVYNQKQRGYDSPTSNDVLSDIMKGNVKPNDISVSLPVCEVTESDVKSYDTRKKKRIGMPTKPLPCDAEVCRFKDVVAETCEKQKVNGKDWPLKFACCK
ncbi:uncharacterized protein N7459_005321 [Penicillium hispanicum]|uniref:uncharacterized protein n=1 Tax=Penicillium hispanicum TaxID=1080232 RepID=UPI00253FCE54|nr:uncharacterized protein N7459_005321 [Penicillium hispanicum]KAJ5585521.1 hypothetical protein N7459_005321 [Penicillium hispanicum]